MAYHEEQGWDSVIKVSFGLAFPFWAVEASACLHLPCYLPPADGTCLCVRRLWVCLCEQGLAFWAFILNEMENTLCTASASCVYVVGQSSCSYLYLLRKNGPHWV